MRKIQLTFLVLAATFLVGLSQTTNLTELEKKIEKLSGEEELEALHILSEGYLAYESKKAILYGEIALRKARNVEISESLYIGILSTLSKAYFADNQYEKALNYYREVYDIHIESDDTERLAVVSYNMGSCYKNTGKLQDAESFYKQSLADAQKLKSPELLMLNLKALYEIKQSRRQYYEAARYLEEYVKISENVFQNGMKHSEIVDIEDLKKYDSKIPAFSDSEYISDERIEELREFFRAEIKSQEEKLMKAEKALENARQATDNKVNFLLSITLLALLGSLVWVAIIFKRKQMAQKLMELQKYEIEKQAELLQEKNSKLKESITYARKIQDSILIPQDHIMKYLPEAFIYYQPKDIVSGDFYWFSKVDDELVLAAIDCTGHGIPGAFMSMIGFTLLNEIVNERRITKPDKILKHLHLGVLAALQQTDNTKAADDGMDMSLCTINPRIKRFQFAGAKNHLYVMQGDKLKVLKANHHSVGGRPIRLNKKVEFSSYDFMYDEQTSIYMMSDGYIDQFGGIENQKFNSDRFKEMLMENRHLPMPKQKELMQKRFDEWRGEREQVDDILVLGVRLQ